MDLMAYDKNILEWAVIEHNSSLIGRSGPMVYAIECLGDLVSQSFRWGDGTVDNVIVTVHSRGHGSYAEAARKLKALKK